MVSLSVITLFPKLEIKKTFIGTSGMKPAFLNTCINTQELYLKLKQKLQRNLNYLDSPFFNREGFTFNPIYPLIYFKNETVSKKLFENKIIITSFDCNDSLKKLYRIAINTNHTIQDLEYLMLKYKV